MDHAPDPPRDLPPDLIPRMVACVGGRRQFDYTIHLSPELGFVFFSNPICACSTLKATLNLSSARALGLPVEPPRAETIHKRAANPLLTPAQIGNPAFRRMLADPGVLKFGFVRDPLARFVSAHAKKLRRETPFVAKVRRHLGLPERTRPADFLSLERFAAMVAEDPGLRDLDEHWRLQRSQVFYDLVPGLELGRVERFAEDTARFLTRIFGAGGYEIVDAVAIHPANSSRNRAAAPAPDAALRAAVARAYAADYDMLAALDAARGGEGP